MTAQATRRFQPRIVRNADARPDAASPDAPKPVVVPSPSDGPHPPHGQLLFRIEELIRENRWEEILGLCYPVETRRPDLTAARMDVAVRSKAAFALSHLKRFNEAIAELEICTNREPGNFLHHSALAFNAYNSVWADKNRETRLTADLRRDRIALAHAHFKKAQEIRPDNVTVFYREGMLYKGIEAKPARALPLFLRAIRNWESMSEREKEARHQERKNYVKSLYQAASAVLDQGAAVKSLELMEKCIAADDRSGHVEPVFKFFALGKIRFAMDRLPEAEAALKKAFDSRRKNQPVDFVFELMGRVYLAAGEAAAALDAVGRVPEHRRRPYVRWTEADALCALGRADEARRILLAAAERDRLSRHKTLLKLARIEMDAGRFDKVDAHAEAADRFFREKWGNPCIEAHYWRGRAALAGKDRKKAASAVETLEKHAPDSGWTARLRDAMETMP